MDIQDQIAVMQHYANGGKVEAQQMVNDPKWVQLSESGAVFNWAYFNYRIKKEPRKFTIIINKKNGQIVGNTTSNLHFCRAHPNEYEIITVTEDV